MSELIEQPKKWYTSKIILVNLAAGAAIIVGQFSPSVGDFIQKYFSELGGGWVAINFLLRLITKDKVSIG